MPKEFSVKQPVERAIYLQSLHKSRLLQSQNPDLPSIPITQSMIDVVLALAAIRKGTQLSLNATSNSTEQPSVKEPVTSIWKAFEKAPSAFTDL